MEEYPRQYLYLRVVRAKLYIDAHFSARIDLRAVAGVACLSRFHFARSFKQIYGRTPHQYLTDVRISHAKEFLDRGRTVASTCFAVGFDSVSSFTGLFKRRVGLTPADYQRRRLARQAQIEEVPLTFVPNCFAASYGLAE